MPEGKTNNNNLLSQKVKQTNNNNLLSQKVKQTNKQQPTKPEGKTNKRPKTCPISTISCITTYFEDQ